MTTQHIVWYERRCTAQTPVDRLNSTTDQRVRGAEPPTPHCGERRQIPPSGSAPPSWAEHSLIWVVSRRRW